MDGAHKTVLWIEKVRCLSLVLYPPVSPSAGSGGFPPGSGVHERTGPYITTYSRFALTRAMGELPVARRFDRCSMTLCDENDSLAILAVEVNIIRETLSHTLGTRKDTAAAYGQGQLESRRTATMLEFPNGSQIC